MTSASRLALVTFVAAGIALPASAANFNVANEGQLRSAISSAQNGDTIVFMANITLSANLPLVKSSVTVNGGNFTLSGNNQYRGLYVESGTVAINNLRIINAVAQGGNGGLSSTWGGITNNIWGGGGGGGAGLGGGLFVGASASVNVTNVSFTQNKAIGGSGAGTSGRIVGSPGGGGGGGLFGDGAGSHLYYGGAGGAGGGGDGGSAGLTQAAPGGFGGGGGGAGGGYNDFSRGGDGGFGGGGGGAPGANYNYGGTPGRGGWGGTDGSGDTGGSGAGLGGAVFVQQGGSLTFGGPLNLTSNSAIGGNAGAATGAGAGLFLQGNGSFTFAPGAGQTQTVSDAIADQTGVAKSGGSWSLVKNGAGTTILTGANAYSGGITINAGVLQGDTSSLRGNISDNASLVFNQQANGTFSGVISGTGAVTKTGDGQLVLTGTSRWSGGTTVSGGELVPTGAITWSGPTTITGGGLRFTTDLNLGAAGGAITFSGDQGFIGTTKDTPTGTTINRPLNLLGSQGGGIDVALNPITWSGVISGPGFFFKSGPGHLTLTGANTYSGGTIVGGGELRLSSDAQLGVAGRPVSLQNGGMLATTDVTLANTVFNRPLYVDGKGGIDVALHPIVWSGVISGSGQFVKSGTGVLQLTGANTYSGGTMVRNGVLWVESDAALGAAGAGVTLSRATLRSSQTFASSRPVTLDGEGFVSVDPSRTLTLNGVVSGGNLVKANSGTLVLNGASSYSYSGATVSGGTLVGDAFSLRGDIRLSGGSVIFDQVTNGGVYSGAITGVGSLVKKGSSDLTLRGKNSYGGGTTVQTGRLIGDSNSLQGNIANSSWVVFDQGFDGKYAGNLTGPGRLSKDGIGKLSITGNNQADAGTYINGGTLAVDGKLTSNVYVSAGGTIAGSNHVVGSVIILNGGKIGPGNSIGTLTINGNLNMETNSTYHVELNGETSDLIKVSGTSNIQSSIFKIDHDTNTASAPVLPGKTYTIITTGGGLAMTAPDVGIADFPFLYFNLSTDGFNGYLTTSRSPNAFAELATTRNEKAVANALDAAATTDPVWQAVVGASEAQARAAFISLSNASVHANAAGVLSEQSQYLRDAVTGRLRQDFAYGMPLAQAGNVLSYAAEAPRNAYAAMPFHKAPPPVIAPRPAQVYSVWAQALGSQGTLRGDGNAAQTNHSLGGVITGLDVTFNGSWRVGLAGGYSQSVFKSPDIAASGSSDSYHIALYGGGQIGAWGLRGGASYSWNDIRTSRQVAVVNFLETVRGDYALRTTQLFGEVGRTFAVGAGALEPFLNLAYVRVDGGINELGLAAMTGSASLDTTYTTLGARGATALTQTLTARGTLGWRHAFGDVTPIATLAFQPGSPFALAGSPIARDALVAEAGLDLAVTPNAFVGVSWAGQFADRSHNNMVKGNLSWRF